jgi:hypothetical protein
MQQNNEQQPAAKTSQWRYLWFGIYLVSVNSESLLIQCEHDTDLSGSDNFKEADYILDYEDRDKDGTPKTYSRLTYSPNEDGKYRLVVDLGKMSLQGQPIVWEFVIDAVGNCTRQRI